MSRGHAASITSHTPIRAVMGDQRLLNAANVAQLKVYSCAYLLNRCFELFVVEQSCDLLSGAAIRV